MKGYLFIGLKRGVEAQGVVCTVRGWGRHGIRGISKEEYLKWKNFFERMAWIRKVFLT